MRIFCRGTARRAPTVIMFIAALCLVSADALADEPVKESTKGEKIDLSKPVASVNGVVIPVLDLKKAMEERIPETGHRSLSEKRLAEIRGELLDHLIVQEILYQEAKRRNIKAAPESIEAEIDKIRSRFPSEAKYREAIKAQGLTSDEVRTGIVRYLMIKQLSDQEVRSKIKISDDEMKTYYNEHREQFKIPEQVRLRLLLVGVDPSALEADWEKARVKAQGFSARAKKGEDFSELAQKFSDDKPTKDRGGDTGLLHQGRLPYEELERVAYAQKIGSVSDPVRTLYGYVIFRVEEKKPAVQLKFEGLNKDLLRKEMLESATEKKLKDWITGLR
ncbi:MAG TPA: peptidylprolyl isomerase, partial [Candidatus Manganitrophaceae bacterium]